MRRSPRGGRGRRAHHARRRCTRALRHARSPRTSPLPTTLLRTHRGREVRPRTAGQRRFVRSIEESTLTFGIGPAGTGKTYLAIVMAVRALKRRDITRVILSRPAVEAGERLGFLPGDLREKVDPYMRPLFDALAELLDDTVVNSYMERGTLEVAPLAYMRGRTLSEAFVILDEAQNATDDQLKMFLTRLGSGSKMVVTGDVTQIDLPAGQRSGLRAAAARLTRHRATSAWSSSTKPTSSAIRWWRRSFAPMIYYRNDVRRSGVDGRALVATAKRLLAAIGEADPRSRSRSLATTRCASSTATTAGKTEQRTFSASRSRRAGNSVGRAALGRRRDLGRHGAQAGRGVRRAAAARALSLADSRPAASDRARSRCRSPERRVDGTRGTAARRRDRAAVALLQEMTLMHHPVEDRGKKEPHYLPIDRSRVLALVPSCV